MPHFDFLKTKIIKAECRWHLNRIISAFNIGSHIVNQVETSLSLSHHTFTFEDVWNISQYEFNSNRIAFYRSNISVVSDLFILNKNALIAKK